MSIFGKLFKKKDDDFSFADETSNDSVGGANLGSQGQQSQDFNSGLDSAGLPPLDSGLSQQESSSPAQQDEFNPTAFQANTMSPPQDFSKPSQGQQYAHQYMQQQKQTQQPQQQRNSSNNSTDMEIVGLKIDALKSEVEALKAHIKHLEELVKKGSSRW